MKIKKTLLIIGFTFLLTSANFAKAQDISTSSDEIRKRVQEKISQASQKPKGYLGTITDISTNTIQAKKFSFGKESQKTGDIIQIKISETTKIIDNKETTKPIKFQELAIGDFAIFMGKEINGGALEAGRIVLIKPINQTKRVNTKLKISKVEKQKIIASGKNGEYTINTDKNTRVFDATGSRIEIKNLEEENWIIVCGEKENNLLKARSIFLTRN